MVDQLGEINFAHNTSKLENKSKIKSILRNIRFHHYGLKVIILGINYFHLTNLLSTVKICKIRRGHMILYTRDFIIFFYANTVIYFL